MIYLKLENSKVVYINHVPFDEKYGLGKTRAELEKTGLFIDSIPEPENRPNQSANLHCNSKTKELWYEYEDIPKTPEQIQQEELAHLKQEDLNNKEAIAELYMMMPELGGM